MNSTKLLVASFLTILVAGLGFAVRGGLLVEWGGAFGFTQTELGQITGGGFVGFGVVILIASLFLDRFGYKPFLLLAGVLHVLSVVVTVAATFGYSTNIDTNPEAARSGAYFCLFWGIFIFAIANGICEAVVNPLIATLYSKQKTHYLNILHAGWPGGMIIGALLGVLLIGRVRWEIVLGLYLVPTLVYLFMIAKEKFPESEAAAAGVSFVEMLKEFAAPILMLLLFLHVCIGYVELGTDSWIVNIMDTALGGKGLFILLYTSVIDVRPTLFRRPYRASHQPPRTAVCKRRPRSHRSLCAGVLFHCTYHHDRGHHLRAGQDLFLADHVGRGLGAFPAWRS